MMKRFRFRFARSSGGRTDGRRQHVTVSPPAVPAPVVLTAPAGA